MTHAGQRSPAGTGSTADPIPGSLPKRAGICHIACMFGVVRPCRHRLRGPLFGQWMTHLCGLCLTLRDLYGQNARFVTNYDGLLLLSLTRAAEARKRAA